MQCNIGVYETVQYNAIDNLLHCILKITSLHNNMRQTRMPSKISLSVGPVLDLGHKSVFHFNIQTLAVLACKLVVGDK